MSDNASSAGSLPSYSADIYSDEFIADPFPHYAAMRQIGAVIWLPVHRTYAATRYREVRELLRNHRVFSSASGVAADEVGCEFMKGNTVASDPPVHTLMRSVMGEPLLPSALKSVEVRIQQVADQLIADLLERKTFDGISDLARHLPLTIVTELVGLPEEGRENMLKWAAAAFDILGIQNERGRQGVETISEARRYIQTRAQRDQLKAGSWTARIYELAAAGKIPAELCPHLIRDYANPSLDTTISAIGQMLYQIARNPEQWDILRNDHSLIPNAVHESLRLGSPIRSFTRLATEEYLLGGTLIPAGARIMALYASANRDELQYPDAERFDILRRAPNSHLAFGNGIHTCVGIHLALLEMQSLLRAMVSQVSRISAGTPVLAMNNTIHAFAVLPMSFQRGA